MSKKSVIIVANFFEKNDTSRPYMAYNYFLQKGYSVKVYYALFSHSLKKERQIEGKDFYPIKIKTYQKNISFKRIFSHRDFAKKVERLMQEETPDIVYCNLPPNTLGKPLCRLKKKNNFQLIVDVLDLWPEAFPFPKYIKGAFSLTAGSFLKRTRETVLKHADLIITESNYFFEIMKLDRFELSDVIHLKKMNSKDTLPLIDNSKELTISYIGNIGESYDFDSLLTVLTKVHKTRAVSIEIIGEGNLKSWLLKELERLRIPCVFHGATFDENIKNKVIGKSWFGYNGFKNNTEVALSYKSIEYFSFGTPIINSAKGDTYTMINDHNVGINFSSTKIEELVSFLSTVSFEKMCKYKDSVKNFYQNNISETSYYNEMDVLLKKLLE